MDLTHLYRFLAETKRSIKGLSLLVAAAVLLSACSPGVEKPAADHTGNTTEKNTPAPAVKKARVMTGDPAAGKKIFEKYCYFCHGRRGMGNGPIGIAITPRPADFVHDRKRMSKSDEELFKSITYGIQRKVGGKEMSMPEWADILSEQQRWDVLSYVRELSRRGREAEKGASEKTPAGDK